MDESSDHSLEVRRLAEDTGGQHGIVDRRHETFGFSLLLERHLTQRGREDDDPRVGNDRTALDVKASR